jgi:hypothetical protein
MWLAAVAVVIGLDTYLLTEKKQMALADGSLFFNASFNDATRILEGGLWSNPVPESNQGTGNVDRYMKDLGVVSDGLTNLLPKLDQNADATQIDEIHNILAKIVDIQANVAGATNDADAAAAQTVRADHLDILTIVNGDTLLHDKAMGANPVTHETVNGFQDAPPAGGLPAGQPQTFAEIGAIFDDAQNLSLAGVNAQNHDAIVADLTTARDALVNLIDSGGFTDPTAMVHAQKIVNCFNLELDKYIPEYGHNPDVARGTNDVFLDLTDIVTGDDTLTAMATDPNTGVHGWTPAPDANVDSTPYQDNAAQTNFLASFIAGVNTLGSQADAIAQQGFDPKLVNKFEHVLDRFEANVQKFDENQGGIYAARFDNELAGNFGTIGAAIKGIEQGLDTHNAALVTAGVQVLEDNAADVGSNNIPVGGGSYNTDATTAADAAMGAHNKHLVPHGDNGLAHRIGVAGNNAPIGGENGVAAGAVDTQLVPSEDNAIAQATGVGGAANTHPVPHGDLVGLLQAMSETADVAGNIAAMGAGNGAAPGTVNTHLVELLHHAMTGNADIAGNNSPTGEENGAVMGAVNAHLVPHGDNGIDHVDHMHHALTETIGHFHG